MKQIEQHFDEYVKNVKKYNLHSDMETCFTKVLPLHIEELPNFIFYGPPGIGKYSQVLHMLNKYSPSHLKYEKKMYINSDTYDYYIKISDIHFEINMETLGCNAKTLWNLIYDQINDTILSKNMKTGIVVCKNFHAIHSELLEIFYNYINVSNNIKFVLITNSISFIPENILNVNKVISLQKPTNTKIKNCFKLQKYYEAPNLKYYISKINSEKTYTVYCDFILEKIINYKKLSIMELREQIYNLFIYQFDIQECFYYITQQLIKRKYLTDTNTYQYFFKLYNFFLLFNNNYRPIYHVENIMLQLCKIIHGF